MSAHPLAAWSASGAAWLTGLEDGPPLGAPDAVASSVERGWERLIAAMTCWGDPDSLVGLDPLALLGERAALVGLQRHGSTNCSGSTRLMAAADGWLAVALARPDDVDALPAWLDQPSDRFTADSADSLFEHVAADVASRSVADLVTRGALLGMAVGGLGEAAHPAADPVVVDVQLDGPAHDRPPLVVDLSSLWAGPLCSQLLAAGGANVVKVESRQRPDGLRRDRSGFFDVLNVGKRSVALDLQGRDGTAALSRLIAAADVVIEASRPRALAQLGIDAAAVVADGPDKVWLSITGHGRSGDAAAMRVGFGDDAAVAGGLVGWATNDQPCFLGDAIADPLTGIAAAAAVADAYAAGGGWLLDVALARVAASAAAGGHRPSPVLADENVARPRARTVSCRAADLGAHTDEVLAEVRLR